MSCTANGFPIPETGRKVGTGLVRLVNRRISPQAGHALEVLGHAIDYLIDESKADGSATDTEGGRTKAINLLMEINRLIYLDCPEVPTIGQALHTFLHSHGV